MEKPSIIGRAPRCTPQDNRTPHGSRALPRRAMSQSFLAAVEARSTASALRAAFTQPDTPVASPLALMMRADLAAGRLTTAEYVQEARRAGVSLLEITATLKNHMKSNPNTDAPAEDVVHPAGTYYGRTHSTPVTVVDGIFVPVTSTGPAAPDATATSLAWLREHGGAWGPRAAERLGPENDFMPDLELQAQQLLDNGCRPSLTTAPHRLSRGPRPRPRSPERSLCRSGASGGAVPPVSPRSN